MLINKIVYKMISRLTKQYLNHELKNPEEKINYNKYAQNIPGIFLYIYSARKSKK